MDNTLGSTLAIILLIAANAFFVAAEFALVKARKFRISALADNGSRAAILTRKIQSHLEAYLAACQLGITMASLGLGWVGEPAVAALLEPLFHDMGLQGPNLHTAAFIVGFLIFSSLHIVIGEQVPKTFAIRKPEPVSLWVAYPLQGFYLIAYPLNWVLNKTSSGILSLFGVAEATHGEVFSDDEIRGIINTSEAHGEMDSDKATMLHNLFKFDTRTVEQIMVSRNEVDLLDTNDSWEKNRAILKDTGHSRFPVISDSGDMPTGILLIKDLYNAMLEGDAEPSMILKQVSRKPLFVPENQPIGNLFDTMRQERSHMALVVDEYGGFAGVITMEDLLEEIVGEIADELDIDEPVATVRQVLDHWETDGLTALTDLERALNIHFPGELDANTVTGLFMARLNRMPEVGDVIIEADFRFEAQQVENHRLGDVFIYPLAVVQEPAENSDSAN